MIDPRWKAAANTPFALKCKAQMDKNNLAYHNWQHVLACLDHAGRTFELEYDPILADTILSHDVVYDAAGNNEYRSIIWMYANRSGVSSHYVADGIYKTIKHRPSGDNRMILLDLANFLDDDEAAVTREKIVQESMELYDASRDMVLEANADFLRKLCTRLVPTIPVSEYDEEAFRQVRNGIYNLIGN